MLNVGPGQTYAHLNDAIAYIHSQGWGRPFAGVTFNVYPSSDPNYYLNDGQWYPISGNFPVPVTIQGAAGQTFPKFCGGGLYYAKGFFMGYNYDVWVKNVEICNVTDGSNVSGNDNLAAITKESGCATGNMFVDNVYVHDCQDGINRGHTYTKWFITNSRISHCGVGETGYTHNIYVQGELAYFKNILSDQSSIGHVLKSRAKSTILKNCRLYDGLAGHGSCDIDIPEGGVDTITSTVFHKGPNYQNPQAVHFADSGDSHCGWPSNQLTVSNSTFYGDAWLTGDQVAVRDVSMVGTGDGLAASITMTNNSFYGFTAANYEITAPNSGGGYGATSVTGSVTLTAQAAQDWSFPGPGPDPTVAHPPGPFLAPYGVVNGAQLTFPVNEIRLDSASPVGTSVVNPTFLPGQFSVPSPVWSLRKNPGNHYAINASTGAITTAAALIPGMVDVVEIMVHQDGVNFGQAFTAGGPTYYDHPADGSFIHSISITASGNLPPVYTITASAGTGGTISPSGAVQVASGGSQTFTIAANSGYAISSVTVDGSSVGAVSSYTFNNVTANHTISAAFSSTSGNTIKILKTGAGIDMTYVSNLDPAFQSAGASNVVQVTCNEYECTNNSNGWGNPNWLNATVAGTSDYAFLMKWDISSIPANATVAKAQIRLYATAGNYGGFYIGSIKTSDWTQGTVTCLNPKPGTYWAAGSGQPFGGGDVNTPAYFSEPVANPAVFDVTTDVQAMVRGTMPDYGWAMASVSSFSSSSTLCNDNYATDINTTTAYCPALFVSYSSGDTTPPAAVTNLAISNITATSVLLSWTAPGDDGNTGTATTYDVRYSSSAINDANFSSADPGHGRPSTSSGRHQPERHGQRPHRRHDVLLRHEDR